MRTKQQLISENKSLKWTMGWLLLAFIIFFSVYFFYKKAEFGVGAILLMVFITSLNHSRKLNGVLLDLKELGEEK